VILDLGSSTTSRGEGNRGGGGKDEPTDSESKLSDCEEEDEEEEKDMADQNLEWMTQGPLVLLGDLYKMPKWSEGMLKV